MTAQTLTMPRLGETMEQGVIVRWHKSEGDTLRRGEPLVDIETDKTVAEFPVLEEGVLHKIIAGEGASVPVGEPIAQIEGSAPARQAKRQPMKQSEAAPTKPVETGSDTRKAPSGNVRASPAARAKARANDLAIEQVVGSGLRGRIEVCDVEKMLASPKGGRNVDLHHLQMDAGRLAYKAIGKEDADACWVLLHGIGGDMTIWSAIAAGLERANCRVLVPDMPAHGKTEVEADGIDEIIDAMCEFADTVPQRFHLVGLSLGGKVAVELAKRRVDKVVSTTLVNPVGIGLHLADDYVDGISKAQSAKDVERIFERVRPYAKVKLDDDARKILANQVFSNRLRSLSAELCAFEREKQNVLPELAHVSEQMPVKVVLGNLDEFIPVPMVPKLPPQVALHLFAEAGHILHLDEPGEFLNLLLAGMGGTDANR